MTVEGDTLTVRMALDEAARESGRVMLRAMFVHRPAQHDRWWVWCTGLCPSVPGCVMTTVASATCELPSLCTGTERGELILAGVDMAV